MYTDLIARLDQTNSSLCSCILFREETMQTFKIDIAPGNNAGSDSVKEIQDYFGVKSEQTCPSVVLFKRGKEILDFEIWDKSSSEDFRTFVWDRLKMKVSFENKTPWKLKQFYLDGNRGILKDSIDAGKGYVVSTYLSHAFMFVADHVTGNRLNNEVRKAYQYQCCTFFSIDISRVNDFFIMSFRALYSIIRPEYRMITKWSIFIHAALISIRTVHVGKWKVTKLGMNFVCTA